MKKKEIKKGESWRKGYTTGFEEAMKACGNCKNCYGKGYATRLAYACGTDEFTYKNYRWKLPSMVFCSCMRGKQLMKLWHEEEKIMYKGMHRALSRAGLGLPGTSTRNKSR